MQTVQTKRSEQAGQISQGVNNCILRFHLENKSYDALRLALKFLKLWRLEVKNVELEEKPWLVFRANRSFFVSERAKTQFTLFQEPIAPVALL